MNKLFFFFILSFVQLAHGQSKFIISGNITDSATGETGAVGSGEVLRCRIVNLPARRENGL